MSVRILSAALNKDRSLHAHLLVRPADKLDDKGNEKAKAYLAKADSTRVTIEGTVVDEKIEVTWIKAADKKDAK
ncbi:MAG: hypothetical protein JWO87_914 [Phycisphaerales bacterium]|nr:hypothetical protein [Phycisphaerales bacterium]